MSDIEDTKSINENTSVNTEKKPAIIIDDYKGFTIRTSMKKGYVAFKKVGGHTLRAESTVEEAKRSVDVHLDCERKQAELAAQQREELARRQAEQAEAQRKKTEMVLAVIEPVRHFTAEHGLTMLADCLEQLEQEERERNVPANWEHLVEICGKIAEWRYKQAENAEPWENHLNEEPDVTKYGVKEEITYTRDDHPTYTAEYTLQEYIDEFSDDFLPEDEGEE